MAGLLRWRRRAREASRWAGSSNRVRFEQDTPEPQASGFGDLLGVHSSYCSRHGSRHGSRQGSRNNSRPGSRLTSPNGSRLTTPNSSRPGSRLTTPNSSRLSSALSSSDFSSDTRHVRATFALSAPHKKRAKMVTPPLTKSQSAVGRQRADDYDDAARKAAITKATTAPELEALTRNDGGKSARSGRSSAPSTSRSDLSTWSNTMPTGRVSNRKRSGQGGGPDTHRGAARGRGRGAGRGGRPPRSSRSPNLEPRSPVLAHGRRSKPTTPRTVKLLSAANADRKHHRRHSLQSPERGKRSRTEAKIGQALADEMVRTAPSDPRKKSLPANSESQLRRTLQ